MPGPAGSLEAVRALLGAFAAVDARFTHISIATFDSEGDDVLLATTDLARGMARAQAHLQQGAMLEAARTGLPVIVTPVQRASRFPALTDVAKHLGVHTQLAVPLRPVGSPGAVCVYSTEDGEVDLPVLDVAQRLAALAQGLQADRQLTTDLQAALGSREQVGQACGILMSRYLLTAEDAIAVLRRGSQNRNLKLRELALEVIQTGTLSELDAPRHGDLLRAWTARPVPFPTA